MLFRAFRSRLRQSQRRAPPAEVLAERTCEAGELFWTGAQAAGHVERHEGQREVRGEDRPGRRAVPGEVELHRPERRPAAAGTEIAPDEDHLRDPQRQAPLFGGREDRGEIGERPEGDPPYRLAGARPEIRRFVDPLRFPRRFRAHPAEIPSTPSALAALPAMLAIAGEIPQSPVVGERPRLRSVAGDAHDRRDTCDRRDRQAARQERRQGKGVVHVAAGRSQGVVGVDKEHPV